MKIPVHNPNDAPIYVGTSMILPGETRHFDVNDPDLPAYLRPAPEAAPEEAADAMAELLKLGVKDIAAEFDLLDAGELDRLEALENAAEPPRKTLLSAISEEKLRRAAAAETATAEVADPAAQADPVPADPTADPAEQG